MEVTVAAISNGIEAIKINEAPKKHYRIQVSNTKKPMFFYLNLAKRYMRLYNDVELSALGMAIPTVVTIAEILKSNGLATEKHISTSTVGSKDDIKGRQIQKAKIEILLRKTENFEELTLAAAKGRVTEKNFTEPTKSNAEALMTENSTKPTTNTADGEAQVTANSQEMATNSEVKAPVTELSNPGAEVLKKAAK